MATQDLTEAWRAAVYLSGDREITLPQDFIDYSSAIDAAKVKANELTATGEVVTEWRTWFVDHKRYAVDPRYTLLMNTGDFYERTVCCADVYVGDPMREPDGTIVYVMRQAPRLWERDIKPGDHLIIDPERTPQTGDWVHVGEGPGFMGMAGIGGGRFKQFPCEEGVLGVIVAHFPKIDIDRMATSN